MIQLKGFQGHMLLYCKRHYSMDNFLLGLRRIWALRCGLDNIHTENGQADRYIANALYDLLKIVAPEKLGYFHEILHSEMTNELLYNGLKPIERLIIIYANELAFAQIRKKIDGNYVPIIQLPEPNQPLFERIISGKAEYSDYKLVES